MIYNYIYSDKIVKTAGVVAMGASSMLSRASTSFNYGYGEDLQSMLENQGQSPYTMIREPASQMIYKVALLIQ